MSFDQALSDGESETRAAISLRRTRLVELLENRSQLVRSDAHSGIPDGHIGEILVLPRRDRHLATALRKLQSIAGKIVENLAEALAIGKDDEAWRNIDDDVYRLLAVDLRDSRHDFLNNRTGLKFLAIQ